MRHTSKRALRRLLHAIGLDVHWHVPEPRHHLLTLLNLYGVSTVFDIGANIGMSGQYLRNLGFRGDIVSFEPVKELYEQLREQAADDPRWRTEHLALGDVTGEMTIHVSGGAGGASSFLRMRDEVTVRAPELRVLRDERVHVSTIDEVSARYYPTGDRLFLKLDVQGYEQRVLEGARRSLDRVVGMRIEVSVVESYQDEPLLQQMLPYLYGLGFRLTSIEHAWSHPKTQEVYQLDATLFRPERL